MLQAAARLRGLGIDPLVGMGGLSLDANTIQRAASGAEPLGGVGGMVGNKVQTDLKMHSVFGTGNLSATARAYMINQLLG